MINEYDPQTVTHPGVTLYEKIQEMGLSVEEFSMRIHEPKDVILSIIEELGAITPEIATALENGTQIPARFWLDRQARYDEAFKEELRLSEASGYITHEEALARFAEWGYTRE
jgi:addiction module HigA family antidote